MPDPTAKWACGATGRAFNERSFPHKPSAMVCSGRAARPAVKHAPSRTGGDTIATLFGAVTVRFREQALDRLGEAEPLLREALQAMGEGSMSDWSANRVLNMKAEQVATFLGRRITRAGAGDRLAVLHPIVTCVKHRFGKCSISDV